MWWSCVRTVSGGIADGDPSWEYVPVLTSGLGDSAASSGGRSCPQCSNRVAECSYGWCPSSEPARSMAGPRGGVGELWWIRRSRYIAIYRQSAIRTMAGDGVEGTRSSLLGPGPHPRRSVLVWADRVEPAWLVVRRELLRSSCRTGSLGLVSGSRYARPMTQFAGGASLQSKGAVPVQRRRGELHWKKSLKPKTTGLPDCSEAVRASGFGSWSPSGSRMQMA